MKTAGLSLITWPVWAIFMAITALVTSSSFLAVTLIIVAFALGGALVVGRRGRVILTIHLCGVIAVLLFRALATLVFPQGDHGSFGLPPISLGPLTLFGSVSLPDLGQAVLSGAGLAAVVATSGVVLALTPLANITAYLPRALGPLSTALGVSVAVLHSVSQHISASSRTRTIRPHASRRAILLSALDGVLADSVTLATHLEVIGENQKKPMRSHWRWMMMAVLSLAVVALVAQTAGFTFISWAVVFCALCLGVVLWWRGEQDISHLRPVRLNLRDLTVMITAALASVMVVIVPIAWSAVIVPLLFTTPLWCAEREHHVNGQ